MEAVSGPLQFSTDELPEGERAAVWREIIGMKIARLDFEPLRDQPFYSHVWQNALPGVVAMRGDVSAHASSRTPSLVSDGNDAFALVLLKNSGGRKLLAAQRGREAELAEGDAVLMAFNELGCMVQPTSTFYTLQIPRARLAALVPDVEDCTVRRIRRESQALRLLTSYLGVLQSEEELATAELKQSVATHIQDLTALAIGTTRDAGLLAASRGGRAARLREIKLDIAQRLDRDDLTIGALSGRHGLQPRYIQRLFEDEGATFSEFVLKQRLLRAHRRLTDIRHRDSSIGEIAYACGFNDQSYFNRCFKRLYGVSPSDVREAARRGQGALPNGKAAE